MLLQAATQTPSMHQRVQELEELVKDLKIQHDNTVREFEEDLSHLQTQLMQADRDAADWHARHAAECLIGQEVRRQRRKMVPAVEMAGQLAHLVCNTLPALESSFARDAQVYGSTRPVATCAVLIQNAAEVLRLVNGMRPELEQIMDAAADTASEASDSGSMSQEF